MTVRERASHADVVIVGAGPVGLTLALLLSQSGRAVAVVERWPKQYSLPRAVAIDHDVLRLMSSLELGERLAQSIEPWGPPDESSQWRERDLRGDVLMSVPFKPTSPSGWPARHAFSQPDLETLLEEKVRKSPNVVLHRGVTLTSVHREAALVTAYCDVAQDGAVMSISSRYLVACDGANSTVRALMEFETEDLGFNEDWLVVDVELGDNAPKMPYACQFVGPPRTTTVVRGGPPTWRWEFQIRPEDDALVPSEPVVWNLLSKWGVGIHNSKLHRFARYTLRARWAKRWSAGGVILAGDAAHQMPPFLGQGFNSGIRDAANLAWRLCLLLNNFGTPCLLKDYETERMIQVQKIVSTTVAIGEILSISDPVGAAARNESLRRGTGLPDVPKGDWPLCGGTLRENCPNSGQVMVRARGGERDRAGVFSDIVGPTEFLLLASDDDPASHLTSERREAWAAIGGVIVSLGDGVVLDPDGTYQAWFSANRCKYALVRPDYYVFGTAESPEDCADLIDDFLARVGGPAIDRILRGAGGPGGH